MKCPTRPTSVPGQNFDGRLAGQTRLGMLPNMFQHQLKAAFKVPAKGCVPMLAGHAKSIQSTWQIYLHVGSVKSTDLCDFVYIYIYIY